MSCVAGRISCLAAASGSVDQQSAGREIGLRSRPVSERAAAPVWGAGGSHGKKSFARTSASLGLAWNSGPKLGEWQESEHGLRSEQKGVGMIIFRFHRYHAVN